MKQKGLTKTFIMFMMISNWKNIFGLHGLCRNISALHGLNTYCIQHVVLYSSCWQTQWCRHVYSRQHFNGSTTYYVTGRDSVLAQHQRGDQGMSHQMRMTQDQKDADLILRLQDHMYRGWGGYDLKYLKDALQKKDKNKASKLPKHEVGANLHYINVFFFQRGIVFIRQNLTYVDVRSWRIKTIPRLKNWNISNGRRPTR